MTSDSSKLDKSVRDQANSSGYLFQLAIENAIRTSDVPYEVVVHEYPYQVDESDAGFMDLVLTHESDSAPSPVLIECKRVTDEADWVFICDESASPTQRAVLQWGRFRHEESTGGDDFGGFFSFEIVPESLHSEFCVVRGEGDKRRPLLERDCGYLLSASDALSLELLSQARSTKQNRHFACVPILVTSANLRVFRVPIGKISLVDGKISKDDSLAAETVPFIRFTKSLSTAPTRTQLNGKLARDLRLVTRDRERTVFVVNSEAIVEFLKRLSLHQGLGASFPWEDSK